MDSLNKWLTLAANIGVIAGIAFLAIEVNQNSHMMKAQTRSDISKSITDLIVELVNSPYFADFTGIDTSDTEQISQLRAANFAIAQLRTWENIHYQYRNGLYEESEFSKEKNTWKNIINRPVRKNAYCESKYMFSDEFVAELDLQLNEPCDN